MPDLDSLDSGNMITKRFRLSDNKENYLIELTEIGGSPKSICSQVEKYYLDLHNYRKVNKMLNVEIDFTNAKFEGEGCLYTDGWIEGDQNSIISNITKILNKSGGNCRVITRDNLDSRKMEINILYDNGESPDIVEFNQQCRHTISSESINVNYRILRDSNGDGTPDQPMLVRHHDTFINAGKTKTLRYYEASRAEIDHQIRLVYPKSDPLPYRENFNYHIVTTRNKNIGIISEKSLETTGTYIHVSGKKVNNNNNNYLIVNFNNLNLYQNRERSYQVIIGNLLQEENPTRVEDFIGLNVGYNLHYLNNPLEFNNFKYISQTAIR